MKLKKVCLFLFALIPSLVFISCETTKVEEKETAVEPQTKQDIRKTEKQTKKEEPKDPPNVVFAKKLQKALDAGDVKGAIALFDTMPATLENDIELKLLLGALYLSDSQYDKAINTAKFIISLDPDNMEAYELLALASKAKGDRAGQKAATEKILEKDPYNVTVNIQKAEEYAVAKKYKLARESYKKALKNTPDNGDALFGFAQMSYYLDDLKSARSSLEKILEKDPKNSQALAYMGKLSADDGNYVRAEKYVREAIKVDPVNYDYYMDLGSYLRYQGEYTKAIEAWNKAVSLDPSYFLAYAYLAGCYDEQNKYQEALDNYHKVIETNPKYFYAYESTAILEYHLGNYERSRKYFAEAYKYSQNVSYPLMIAATYYKQKDSFHAKEFLKPLLKNYDKESMDYLMLRFFYDNYSSNAENVLVGKITKENSSTVRGKMWFYMGLYYELNNFEEKANEYYAKVTSMKAPMFFEYRIAEWGVSK